MNRDRGFENAPRLFMGLAVVGLGVMFTLDKLNVVEVSSYWAWWPLLLLALGVGRLLGPDRRQGIVGTVVLILIGGWMLLYNLEVVDWHIWDFWPVILVAIGAAMVWRSVSERRRFPTGPVPPPDPVALGVAGGEGEVAAAPVTPPTGEVADTVNAFALLGGVERRVVSQHFRGGSATAILGACVLDLSQARVTENPAVIDAFAFWGGVDIKVPEDWSVEVHGIPVLGGFGDETRHPATVGQVLVVKGVALMGGVGIKN